MSIEITGPQKYRFQDRVCALLTTMHADNAGASLEIEPQDGEDASLQLAVAGNPRVLEIQVKGANGAVDLEKLAHWLTHFPPRQAANSLVERLISDPERTAVFIATGRCDDSTSVYEAPLDSSLAAHGSETIKPQHEASIRAALGVYAGKAPGSDGDLKRRQRAHVGTLLSRTTKKSLKDALRRVLVVERLSEDDVTRLSRENLKKLHRVVPDLVEVTWSRIEAIVFDAKRTGRNIIPEVRLAIADGRAREPLTSEAYVPRGDEGLLRDRLADRRALLLAGPPRVGKTTTARWLAAELQDLGFRVRVTDDVAAAQRFLVEPVRESRLALVDDPLGGAHVADGAMRQLNLLERLVPMLATDRRLIVAQAQDRLLEACRQGTIKSVRTGGVPWVEMDAPRGEFLAVVWAQACESHAVSQPLAQRVREALLSSQLALEPGCLVHLAANYRTLGKHPDLAAIARHARQDARSLGSALRADGMGALAGALAITTTSEVGVFGAELAFALGSGGPGRAGQSNVKGTMINFGAWEPAEPGNEVRYDPAPRLSGTDVQFLESLELRRIVSLASDGTYSFTHPFYRASAESLLDAATASSQERAVQMIDRSLFCLAPLTASAAARNLSWLYDNLDTERGRAAVVQVATDGLDSIFPAARDACFTFLARRLEQLPIEQQGFISRWVASVTRFNVDDVEWYQGQPRIPRANRAGMLEVDPFPEKVTPAEVEPTLRALNGDVPSSISPEAAARAVMFFRDHPKLMTTQSTGRLLSYDVALIRAPVAGAWLETPREHDDDILGRIFGEEHPAVAIASFRAVVRAWDSCTAARREQLRAGLVEMASSPSTAAALVDLLVLFGRREETGPHPPWALFEILMPKVLEVLPAGASVSDARLYNVLRSAMGKISPPGLLQIVDHWIELVQGVAKNHSPSDYLLGVTAILVEGTEDVPESRGQRVRTLLSIPGTGTRIRVIADLVDLWHQLTDQEQAAVMEQLTSKSEDSAWLQAAALSRNERPEEIEAALLPAGLRLSDQPAAIVEKMPAALLNATLHVFTGWHPAVYYVGAHGAGKDVWEPVVVEVAGRPDHALFGAAWDYLMIHGKSATMAGLIRQLGGAHTYRLFDLMLEHKRRVSGEFLPNVWLALFEVEPADAVKSDWIARMASCAPEVLNELGEMSSWIPKTHQEEFLSHFKPDITLLELILLASELTQDRSANEEPDSPPLREAMLTSIRMFVEKMPVRHWSTYDLVASRLKQMGVRDKPLFMELDDRRRRAVMERPAKPERADPILDNWVSPVFLARHPYESLG